MKGIKIPCKTFAIFQVNKSLLYLKSCVKANKASPEIVPAFLVHRPLGKSMHG